jgi:signal transduction histidine kinase
VALGYRVDVLRRRASTDGSALAGPLDELRHDFSEVLADLRLQIADLRIAVRPDQGLGAVIGARLQRFGSSTGLRVVLRLNESGFRLPAHVETMVYRLLLDILSDARLAPGATAVDVTLDVAPPQVFLRVHHDGTSSLRAEDFREHPMTALGADILVEPHSPAGVVVQMHLRQRSSDGASPLTRERIPQRS